MARRAKRKDFIPRPIVLALIFGEILTKPAEAGFFVTTALIFLLLQIV